MRPIRRIPGLAALILALAGCAGHQDRSVVLDQLDPAPMAPRAWAHVAGTYAGPIRASSQRGGFEGYSATETRLDLGGTARAPEVVLKLDTGFSTAWAMYGERKGLYTNIPSKRYGSQGTLRVSTHAPNQMLLETRRFGASAGTGVSMILTFVGNGTVEVDWLGHSGWRGDGELWRVTPLAGRN